MILVGNRLRRGTRAELLAKLDDIERELRLGAALLPTVKPTPAERRSTKEAEAEYARGEYVPLENVLKYLES